MNEQAINTVITGYAIENANLKIQVATLQAELEKIQQEQKQNEEEKGEVE